MKTIAQAEVGAWLRQPAGDLAVVSVLLEVAGPDAGLPGRAMYPRACLRTAAGTSLPDRGPGSLARRVVVDVEGLVGPRYGLATLYALTGVLASAVGVDRERLLGLASRCR